jgi:hypothetical protein
MNKFSLTLILAATAAIAVGISQMPEEVEHTNSVGAAMINKLKQAFPRLSQTQYNNANSIIQESSKWITSQNQLAYVLATAIGESNLTPIKEYRAAPGTYLRRVQDRYWYTGYYGRGYVQLTWKSNYQKFASILGINLVGNPDLALNPKYAAQILVYGMAKGSFTGVSLSTYINSRGADFLNARRIINGMDKASTFKGYCERIVRARG